MKKLSLEHFNKSSQFIKDYGRPLERQIYENYFNKDDVEGILKELRKYQNQDGGFGNGLEPDFRLPLSSPMATSNALNHLVKLRDNEKSIDTIRLSIKYLEGIFESERNGWFAVPKEVNDFPHAPWWHFNEKECMTVIDYSWGNPSAEIIAYLYKYKDIVSTLDVEQLLKYAVDYFNSLDKFESEHEVYCYKRLYELLPYDVGRKIEHRLVFAVQKLVCNKREEWDNYVPQPLKFVNSPESFKYGISDELIEENLDYLVDNIMTNGIISPSWVWNSYETEWEEARKEWTGVLTLDALITLDKFNRIER